MTPARPDVLEHFQGRTDHMVTALRRLVALETSSVDVSALERFTAVFGQYLSEMTGKEPKLLEAGEERRPHMRLDLGEKIDVLLIGHFDTVYATGTESRHPSRVDGDRLYGVGVLDMKSGIVIMAEVARWLQAHRVVNNVTLFFNSDEEIGSKTSGPLMRALAAEAKMVLVFDYTDSTGALRDGSRGVRQLVVTVHGKGGHAAYSELNVNPVDGVADVIVKARRYHRPHEGVVVVPTVLRGAQNINVVPDVASVAFDVRGASEALLNETQKGLERIRLDDERLTVKVELRTSIPTLEVTPDNYASALAKEAAVDLGFSPRRLIEARGASDANQVASVNPHVLDGLGGWGDGAHSADREHVLISSLSKSAAVAGLMLQKALQNEPV